jgi:hypothetical protein
MVDVADSSNAGSWCCYSSSAVSGICCWPAYSYIASLKRLQRDRTCTAYIHRFLAAAVQLQDSMASLLKQRILHPCYWQHNVFKRQNAFH